MTLYVQRQDILRQLAEVDTNIKYLESQIQEKLGAGTKAPVEDAITGDADIDRVGQLITRCMQDPNGLRDALKVVDACKYVQENPSGDDEITKQKLHFRNVLVHESLARARDLAMDPNGSDLLQHLVPILSSGSTSASLREVDYDPKSTLNSELLLLVDTLGSELVATCCNTNGARVTQRVIECLATVEEFEAFVNFISPSVVELAKDINGNHSLSKLMTSAKFKRLGQDCEDGPEKDRVLAIHKKTYESVSTHCIDICKNRQGCCIIQKCLQWAPEPYYTSIINTVLTNALKLVQDPFGNYVVQFILDRQQDLADKKAENGDSPNYTNQIIRQMLHHVAELSCNKFSSNVIEKCLKTASPDVRQLLVDELTDPQVLPKLLTDSYANYVIQTAISTASDDGQFTQLRDSIMPLQNLLKNSPYGVKIEAKLSRRHRESVRKQSKKKESQSQQAPPTPDAMMNPPFIPGMPPIQALMPPDGSLGQQLAFTNITPEMASLFHQQQMMGSMPFVLQGPQQVIGLPNPSPQAAAFTMSMLNSNGIQNEYRYA